MWSLIEPKLGYENFVESQISVPIVCYTEARQKKNISVDKWEQEKSSTGIARFCTQRSLCCKTRASFYLFETTELKLLKRVVSSNLDVTLKTPDEKVHTAERQSISFTQ